MNFRRSTLIGVVFFAMSIASFAASPTARIHGTVTDPQGGLLPGAEVTATNESTGVTSTTVTKGDGSYEFLALPIGTYSISTQAPGFQKFKAAGIKLDIDTNYVEPVKLSIGSASDTVNVSAEAVQVDTSNMQLNNVVGAAQIVELPLLGRDFTQLELTLPGVQESSDRFGGVGSTGGAFSVNGAQTQQSSFLVNGTDTNDLPLNTLTFRPNIDALSEFNLITSSLNAEYSRNSGAIVSASIKNGTNAFHGDVYEFYRDTFLNTANYFEKDPTARGGGVPPFHENLFGGTLGGPIFRDKLFFFGSYEGERGRVPEAPGTQSGTGNVVYSQAQLGGDFSGTTFSSNVIPASLNIPGCTSGTTTFAQCFVNGQIPVTAFNPVSTALIQKFVPLPNAADNIFNFNPTTTQLTDQGIGRIDWSPTVNDKIYGVVAIQHNPTSDDLSFLGGTLPGFGETQTSEVHQYTADWTHQFGSSSLNDFSLHYTRFNFGTVIPQHVLQPSSLGFSITSQNPQFASVPLITVGGDFILGFSGNGPQPRIDNTYQVDDSFSKILGKHSLKFGYDGRKFIVNNPFFSRNSGSFTFSDQNPVVGSGSALVDFLLGIPNAYSQNAGSRIDAFAFENYVYGQDQWKITSTLTLNLGLGYQIDTALHNRQFGGVAVNCFVPGEQSKVFPTAPLGLVYPGDAGCNDAQASTTRYGDLGPRIGFAWAPNFGRLGNSGNLSIRAGYGIYYNRTEEEGSLQNLNTFPFGASATLPPSQHPQFVNPFLDITTANGQPAGFNPFPFTFPKPGDKNIDFGNQFFFISQYGPGYRPSSSQNFNLTVQRTLPSNIVLTVSYVGALGRHLQTTLEGNPVTQAGHDACLTDPVCVANANIQNIIFPDHVAHPVVATGTDVNAGLNIIPADGLISSTGTSNYNSLQVSATKAPTHGLLFQASYTYGHALDQASGFESSGFGGQGSTSARGYNAFEPNLSYGNSDFDVRHRFVFSPVYEVPSMHNGNAFVNLLATGWELSSITALASGFPIDVSYGGFSGASRSLFCPVGGTFYACPDAPDQVGSVKRLSPRAAGHRLFDSSAFAPEAIGSFGNAARNSVKGLGLNHTNAVISKNFRVPGRESMRLQLRMESDNVFNHTEFNNPNANFASQGSFGFIRGANPGRQTQLAAKLYF